MSFPEDTNSRQFKDAAKELNIDMYGRYDEKDASKILNLNKSTLDVIIENKTISFLQISKEQMEFFGYQLIEFLFDSIVDRTVYTTTPDDKNRILRFPEVCKMTGLSRTTLWRLEKEETFPHRVQLGKASVGWNSKEVQEWIKQRSRVY